MLILYSSESKRNCGIVPLLCEVGSCGGLPNRLGLIQPGEQLFHVCSGSAWFFHAAFAAQAGEEIARDRDCGVSREYVRRVEEPSVLGRLR